MIVCVMPTTYKRKWCIDRSLRCWLAQDHADRRLHIVDGGGDWSDNQTVITPFLRELIRTDPRITYEFAHRPMVLGAKYNHAILHAHADRDDLIALWADDDWHHPRRLSLVHDVMKADGADVGGTISMLSYRYRDGQLYVYAHPYAVTPDVSPAEDGHDDSAERPDHGFLTVPYLLSATMLFPQWRWARSPFPEQQSGSDTAFTEALIMNDDEAGIRVTQINEPRLYCAFIHGDNTGCPVFGSGTAHANTEESKTFMKFSGFDLRRWIGEDAPAFLDVDREAR